ncbi:MAG: 4Fe-4S dicluster domain-containing protein [Gemmatimonadaceae bacterium]|nr:4Fe-4S dicluster domain-containing protein [Gemmatimonadaceae bacterium]NUP71706.1 4Fe-4S dicluster domain-containing protein [Gemmatimonadaceae bacterium]NUR34230.1 4Fe-4S dicluster domain-containing protein [Gemmatimonadaceae bacterium]NUS46542.1 4Fe-4S dicluster domain-containing protein [Gemmatimonadaceae bacterium]
MKSSLPTIPDTCAIPGTPLSDARAGIDACVHCGFCLQACPTYLTLEDENDSPRGRIVLMRALVDGSLPVDDGDVRTHIDRCLGCRACETACPSGVPYGHLLEATRATLTRVKPNPPVARLILFAFARPALLRLVMLGGRIARATRMSRLLSRLPGRFGFAMAMLESTRSAVKRARYVPRSDAERGTATLLTGCVMEGLFAPTNRATERALSANGYAMTATAGQRCCGALHAHAGDDEGARQLARANIAAFERSRADYIVVNAAGCGAMMKEYGQLLAGDAAWHERAAKLASRVRDVSELLAEAGPRPGGALPVKVTYDAPCHLLHAQRLATPPLRVLAAVPGLELVPLDGSEHCCGSAGIYNLIEPDVSDRVLAPKLANIAATRAPMVATGNPGCLMQIGAGLHRAGMTCRAVHPVDLLDASYAAQAAAERGS